MDMTKDEIIKKWEYEKLGMKPILIGLIDDILKDVNSIKETNNIIVEYEKDFCDCNTCGHGGHQGDKYCAGCGAKIKWIA